MNVFRAPDARRFISASLVIGVAFVIFGMSFGVVAVSADLSVAQATVMSLLVFTGASQMSAVSVIASGGTAASALGGAALLAGRNAVYGLALAPVLRASSLPTRLLGAQWVIDETTALVSAEDKEETRRTAFWISAPILYASWCGGTFIGAVIGSNINPNDFGLDAAFPVMFIAMLAPHLRTHAGKRAALFGAVAAVVLAPVMPIGLPILISAFGMLFGITPAEPTTNNVSDGAP